MNLSDFDALSFDCYGTLIDWEAGISAVLGPWARAERPDFSDEEILVAYADNEAAVEAENPTLLYSGVLAEAFRRTGRTLDIPVSDNDAARLGASVPNWPAFPDSAEALKRLSAHYDLIILSNVHREGFAGSNARLGIEFDELLLAEDIGSYKPNLRNFVVLLTRIEERGTSRDRLLHVAQSLFHDHVPAKSIGLSTVWINRRHNRPGWGATPDPRANVYPDWQFSSIGAFADAVEAEAAAVAS
jgi:2-haloalkanoic acid dehalogenase type II